MIAHVFGKVVEKFAGALIVDVHGVGYEVQVAAGDFDAINLDSEVKLHTYHQVSENAERLINSVADINTPVQLVSGAVNAHVVDVEVLVVDDDFLLVNVGADGRPGDAVELIELRVERRRFSQGGRVLATLAPTLTV